MRINKLREAGPYATETYCEAQHSSEYNFGRFEIVSCCVVYADSDKPSHSVRIFLLSPELPQ